MKSSARSGRRVWPKGRSLPACQPGRLRLFQRLPFLFGNGAVMKYAAVPLDPPSDPKPNLNDPNYLRNALIRAARGA